MRIVFIESDPQYVLGLPAGFVKQGCQVKIVNDIEEEKLKSVFREFRPELIVTAGWTRIHTEQKLELLARLNLEHGVKHAYWATEDPRWTDTWSLPYIKAASPDYIFTIDRASVPLYQSLGYKAHYLPWACNPDFHRQTSAQESYRCDIALVATAGVTWSSYRKDSAQILLKPLVEKKYNVVIWGMRWDILDPTIVGFNVNADLLRGRLPYEDTNHVYSSAKIVLGFQNTTTELTARTFEIMGAGGFLLAPATRAVLETFTPGKHLAVSRAEDETLKVVDYYLNNEEERRKVASNGRSEVYRKYTYSIRAAEMLNVIRGS
ncbi:MAG: glycosyltransferase [Firmicutes bacterium]|nr:glycosyltransferase [Bacillota bacterium]